MRVFLSLFWLLVCIKVDAQIITTVVGGGTGGLGDGNSATAAKIGNSGQFEFDRYCNFYIGDANYSRIRKVDGRTGIITTIAGTGISGYNGDNIIATTAQIENVVTVVTVDTAGNVIFGETARIRKVSMRTGIITTIAGTGVIGFSGDGGLATAAQVNGPWVAADRFGNIYFNDCNNLRIRKIDPSGIITTIAGTGISGNAGDGGPATAAQINYVLGMCCDKAGNIYFCDNDGAYVRKITVSTGIISRVAGTGDGIGLPYLGDGIAATSSHINPFGVDIDDTGNVYISDYGNSRIEKVDTNGIIHTIAGDGTYGFAGDGGLATNAKINRPQGVTLDACNNVYIMDFGNQRIRKVTCHVDCNCEKMDVGDVTTTSLPISIYPNPATEELHINDVRSSCSYILYNTLGQAIAGGALKQGNNTVPVQNFSPGLYLLYITDEAGRKQVHRVVKGN